MDFRKLLAVLVLWVAPAFGQTTTVTGTIVDPNGNPYATGTASAFKQVPLGQNPGTPVNSNTSNLGAFSMVLPSPASYVFTICAPPTQIGPTGNPTPVAVCFSNPTPIAISGASQDVSAALNPSAKILGPNFTTINAVGLNGPGNIVGTFGGSPTMNGTWTFANPIAGSITGNAAGNAGTATALAAAPSQCGATLFAKGVTASGNANCTQPAFTDLSGSLAHSQLPALVSGDIPNNSANTTGNAATATNVSTSGNGAIKYATASAYRYVDGAGSDSNDGLSPGTAFATPQHCNTVVLGLGGGTCDVRTLYSYIYSTELDVGAHASGAGTPVTMLFPPYGAWTCNVTGGARCLQVFDRSTAISTTSGQGNLFIITASSSANVIDVCGTEPSPGVGGSYLHMEGISCADVAGTTISGFVMHIQSLFDLSRVVNVSGSSLVSSGRALGITNVCCSAIVDQAKGNANNVGTPCTLGNNSSVNGGGNIGSLSCTNAGTGLNDVAIVQFNTGSAAAHYHDIYTEEDNASDTTTAVVGVTGSNGNADVIERLTLGADQSGSTRCMIQNASGVSLVVKNTQLGGISGCFINDGNAGRGILSPGSSVVISEYSTDPNVPVISYVAQPTLIPVVFANLGTPANGTLYFCSNCTIANPCAGSGTGAIAKRLNGVWVCN